MLQVAAQRSAGLRHWNNFNKAQLAVKRQIGASTDASQHKQLALRDLPPHLRARPDELRRCGLPVYPPPPPPPPPPALPNEPFVVGW